MKNYYKLLEVNENASQEIISKVFKIHIKLNHPDLFEGEEKLKAEEKMKELNEAYDVLSDETKRKQYDEKLHFEEQQKVQQLNNQELEILKDEVQALRSKIASKEQIIEHFLGGLDLEEYERHASTIQNPSQGVSYTPTETLRSNEDRELEEEHPVKYWIKNFLKLHGYTMFKYFFSVILIIVGFFLIGKITNVNIFEILFRVLSNPK